MLQKLYSKIDTKKLSIQSKTSNLIKQALFRAILKISKILSKKAFFQNNFILRNLQNSYKRQIFFYCYNILLSQNIQCQQIYILQNYIEKNDNYNYSRNKSRNCSQSIVFYSTKKFLISNFKSTHLQNTSIVVVAIRSKQFRLSNIEYFYLKLLKKFYSTNNYIIFEKNIFYRNIYIFTQQVKCVIATKKINKQLYFCLRKFVII